MFSVLTALSALSTLLVSSTARSEPSALTLGWSAPAGCPQQAEVRERIRALIGSNNPSATVLQAEGTVTQTDRTHFHLKLVTRSGTLAGERELDASSCENLSGAAAVSIALLMRSEAKLSEGDLGAEPSSSKAADSEPGKHARNPATRGPIDNRETEAEAERDTVQRPVSEPTRRWRAFIDLPQAALSIGPLSKPSAGVAVAGGAWVESWRFSLAGAAWLRQNLTAEQLPGYGAEVDRLTGTLRVCRGLRRSRFELAPCLALSLEHVSARGTGSGIAPRTERATWLALGAGAQGRAYLASWFSLLLGVDAQLETARPLVSIDGVGALGKLGPAAFTVTLGPEWIL